MHNAITFGQLVKEHRTAEELLEWIVADRVLREFTCLERETYNIEPLCVDGNPAETTADLVENVRIATAMLGSNDLEATAPEVASPVLFESPIIELKEATVGGNRGELKRHEFDVWEFYSEEGQWLSIRMIADNPMDQYLPLPNLSERFATGGLDTLLFVIAPDGRLVNKINDSYGAGGEILSDSHIEVFIIPQTGTYRVEARSYLDDSAGEYTLVIEEKEPFIIDQAILNEYAGSYLEGPWKFTADISVENNLLKGFYENTNVSFVFIPTSETEFVMENDNTIIGFTRNEAGEVDGYEFRLALIHSQNGGQQYRADRLED